MNRPLRFICFYSIATHLGGAERSLLELVSALKENPEFGFEPWVILPKNSGPLIDELIKNNISYDVVPMPKSLLEMSRQAPLYAPVQFLAAMPFLRAYAHNVVLLIKQKKPAIVHTTGIKCHAIAALLKPRIDIPVLWHLRDIFTPGPTRFLLRTLRRIYKIHVIANSQSTAESFSSTKDEVDVVYNGLNPRIYQPSPNRMLHEKINLSPTTPLVGIVGVLARWKGQLEFIEMAKNLASLGSNAHFAIIGAEIYDTKGEQNFTLELKKKIQSLGLENRVHLLGFHKNSVQAINGLDVLVHSSVKPEPFGRVVLEAMACGIPVVASQSGGVLELIENGKTGILGDPRNSKNFAELVKVTLENKAVAAARASTARNVFLERFTVEQSLKKIVENYKKISGEIE